MIISSSECMSCKDLIPTDEVWITDWGPMCHDCCVNAYGTDEVGSLDGSYDGWVDYTKAAPAKHEHKWKEYEGLLERYEYCETCNQKK